MANAQRDENDRPAIIAASSDDGVTIVPVKANASTHALMVDNNTTGSDNGNNSGNAMLDENGVAVWMALSSNDDGSIIEVYGDPLTGNLLIDSN